MTDGNLSVHCALSRIGYVAITKSFQETPPLTTCALTLLARCVQAVHRLARADRAPGRNVLNTSPAPPVHPSYTLQHKVQ